jgi:methionyl-tRNA synthetase
MKTKNNILVTSALPYANGPIHLGHLVEYIQTDIWVRFNKSIGNDVVYICADDAHGTPIMLKAKQQGISPEELISKTKKEHENDFSEFFIQFDHYSSTNSKKNEELCKEIFLKLHESGHISQKVISQFYDEKEKIFLPDRYIKGTCPKCKSEDQYGDSCEQCGATYSPTDLINPISVLSNTKPMTKDTNHYFFNLKNFKDYLINWTKEHDLQPTIKNKLNEWLNDNLNDWDITRDAPYFGFKIPNEENKYFYVWVDAPIGYISAFEEYSKNNGNKFDGIWQNEDHGEIYHFIGKDIAYFHSLFWPSILNGAGYRTPNSIYCHGFLTVNGKKMSKSRGTFIKASDYLKHLDPEFLRYYFASRLNDSIEDIDLNFDDLTKKINSDLVGKLINLASRCSSFLEKNSDLMLSKKLENKEKFTEFLNDVGEIKRLYSQRKYSNAVNKIMSMTDKANQYINENKPWAMKDLDKIQEISTQGLNYFRSIIILLGPVMPDLLKKTENMLNENNLAWENCLSPLLDKKIEKFTPLKTRIQKEDIQRLNNELNEKNNEDKKKVKNMSNEIEYEDFSKINLRVGEIISADNIDGADKLLKLTVNLGELGDKEIFAGIKKFYKADDLVGLKTLVVENLKPKKMKFGTSSGMVLAADSDGDIIVIEASSKIKNGSRVK